MPIFDEDQQRLAENVEPSITKSQWMDWKWHLKHRITTIEGVEKALGVSFDDEEREKLKKTTARFPLSVTPYYLSLVEKESYKTHPVFMQAVPCASELNIGRFDRADPLHEDEDSPVPSITHRYPDRVLFHISNLCSMYCRHCTRKRKVGDVDSIPKREVLEKGIEYIRNTPKVRDVLLSGGDPLMMPEDKLDWVLKQVRAIKHVEIIRIGTRMPVVLPYRITPRLVEMLSKYHPLWINTHFNHPCEVTESARNALKMLADKGFPLGNQSVLLAGVNDCPRIIKALCHRLVQNRVRPYYLYQCDMSEGLSHFRTPIGKGIEILESMRGHTSGLAVPTYVVDAPGGGGKIPVMPNYLVSWGTNKVILRNYEGVITTYNEPVCYERTTCDRKCEQCKYNLDLSAAVEKPIGIERLLVDYDDTTSLTPEQTERMGRRSHDK